MMALAQRIPTFGILRPRRYDDFQWSPVRSMQSPNWLKETYDRIRELGNLAPNWDSNGAHRIESSAISASRVLLSELEVEDMPRPHIAAIPDGGVGIHWRIGSRDLEIEVDVSGEIHFLKTYIGEDRMEGGKAERLSDVQSALNWVTGR